MQDRMLTAYLSTLLLPHTHSPSSQEGHSSQQLRSSKQNFSSKLVQAKQAEQLGRKINQKHQRVVQIHVLARIMIRLSVVITNSAIFECSVSLPEG